jgi:hypothetical protein
MVYKSCGSCISPKTDYLREERSYSFTKRPIRDYVKKYRTSDYSLF